MTEEELVKAMMEEYQWGESFHLILDVANIMQLIGTLQLALRHPKFKESSVALNAQNIIDRLIVLLKNGGLRACVIVAELGNDTRNDI